MNDIERMRKMCLGKSRYKREASVDRAVEKRKPFEPTIRKYYCPLCFGWHLTKKPASRRTPPE